MNKTRLLKLAAFLIALPKQKFNYAVVAVLGEKPMLEALAAKKESCGTVACAMGWTPALFPRKVMWDMDNLRTDFSGTRHLDICSVDNPNVTRDRAMMELFDITQAQVDFLFYPETNGNGVSEYATAKQVGRHIIRFVKWNEKRLAKLAETKRELTRLTAKVDRLQQIVTDADDYDGQFPSRD
jgi:hypothetical protein